MTWKLDQLKVRKLKRGERYLTRYSTKFEQEPGSWAHASKKLEAGIEASGYYEPRRLRLLPSGKTVSTVPRGYLTVGIAKVKDLQYANRASTADVEEVLNSLKKGSATTINVKTGKVVTEASIQKRIGAINQRRSARGKGPMGQPRDSHGRWA